MKREALVAALVVGLALAPGCITFYGSEQVPVRVVVTRDVGTQRLADQNLTLPEGASAMDALRRVADVTTSHGGGFVEAVDGLESQYPDRKVDWFFHLDTRMADVGPTSHTVEEGAVIVFDYRPWNRTRTLEHVLTGTQAWPADLEDPDFERDAFQDRQADPDTRAHLYATVDDATLTLLDPNGTRAATLEAPWLLAHAVDGPGPEPELLLVPSGPQGRGLVDDLAETRPVGVGVAVTPNATLEVPAG